MFEQGQVPAFDGAVKSVHGQVELWIVVIDRADEAAYGNSVKFMDFYSQYNTEISIYLIYMAFAMNYCDDVKV